MKHNFVYLRCGLVKVFLDELGPSHEEAQNLRDKRSEVFLPEATQELEVRDQPILWHTEAVLQREHNEEDIILLRQLANLHLEILRLQVEPTRGPT